MLTAPYLLDGGLEDVEIHSVMLVCDDNDWVHSDSPL